MDIKARLIGFLQMLLLGHWYYEIGADSAMFPRHGIIVECDYNHDRTKKAVSIVHLVLALPMPWQQLFLIDYQMAVGRYRPLAWVRFSYIPPANREFYPHATKQPWYWPKRFQWARGLDPIEKPGTGLRKRDVRLLLDTLQ